MDIKVVSEILGHKDVSVTYNIYIHIIDEQKVSAMAKLNEIFSSSDNNMAQSINKTNWNLPVSWSAVIQSQETG